MKNNMITATLFCILLLNNSINAEDKNKSAIESKKQTKSSDLVVVDKMTNRSISAADFIGDSAITVDATIAFVDSFAIMGECQEGQKARKEIESKRDLASNEIQEESKTFEKAKSDYVSKSTTMSDSAREKEEKKLVKMERDLKTLVAEKEEDLKAEMQTATEILAQGLDAGIAKLAKNEKLDVIFDKMTGRAMYVSEKFDFTSKAITEVNKNYEIKLAQNKQQAENLTKVADNKAITAKSTKVSA
jgi:outer membrane protein